MRTSSLLVLGLWVAACASPARRAPSTPVAVTAVKGGRGVAVLPGPSRAEIPVGEEASKSGSCQCAWPVFEHPDAAARAALAQQVSTDLERFIRFRVSDDEVASASLTCNVTAATRSLVSFDCSSMSMSASKVDWEQGMGGGAPAEDTIETFVYAIDGAAVRKATLADVFADVSRGWAALPALARAAVVEEDGSVLEACPKWALPELRSDPLFTVSDAGLTLYFHHADYPNEQQDCWRRTVVIGREALAPWAREDGVLGRVGE